MTPSSALEPVIVIEPKRGLSLVNFRELWEYRELLSFLAWRDLKVRYKQTVLGIAWAIIQPVFTMLVFSLFFGKLAQMPSDGIPYPAFTYSGLVPWTFFATSLTISANSLVNNPRLLTKVYFPRVLIPLASILPCLVDFALAFGVLVLMMVGYGLLPTANIIWLPFFLIMAVGTALGAGLWLAALNVQFRDVRYAVPFLIQFWLFCTPVAYPSSLLSEPWRILYGINPMVGVVDGFRWALLDTRHEFGWMIGLSIITMVVLLVTGLAYFRKMERTFADIV